MRIAFVAPMKHLDDPAPSGDRRVVNAFANALKNLGHDVFQVSSFRSYDGTDTCERQNAIKRAAFEIPDDLLKHHANQSPKLCFTYHVYHKSPDWIRPTISGHLNIQ